MKADRLRTRVTDQLFEIADLLEQQGANPFRVNAFRKAARTLSNTDLDLEQLVRQEGIEGLMALPDIGAGISKAIYEIVATGNSSRLATLRGSLHPERLFQTIPGVGVEMAHKLYAQLHVETLEALETAAHDGRLEQVDGVGPRRAAAIRAALASMLGRARFRGPPAGSEEVAVATILDVDSEYRGKAAAGRLRTISPRRFNPDNEAWMPILHTVRGQWHFTALFSNTARAHELNKTRDWVVIYFYDDDHHEYQHTVVTETHGSLSGRRVVRGREAECRVYYLQQRQSA